MTRFSLRSFLLLSGFFGVLLLASAPLCAGITDQPQSAPSYEVNTLSDSDDGVCGTAHCTLREALNAANNDGQNSFINFARHGLASQTITLGGTPLPVINETLAIFASVLVTVSGNNQSRVFEIATGASLDIYKLNITSGRAASGGAIWNRGTLFLRGNSVRANSATASDGSGGAILNEGTLTMQNCEMSFNSAYAGGAIFNRGELFCYESTFSDNSARYGGGLYVSVNRSAIDSATIYNCTFANNNASQSGGGIFNVSSRTSLDSCTIAGNRARANQGGGVGSFGTRSTITRTRNSIIAGNMGDDAVFLLGDSVNTFESIGYNLIGTGNATGAFNSGGDQVIGSASPGLGPLADNGGPTPTRALQSDSPAVDAGNTDLPTDQRVALRPFDGDGDGIAQDDIGAFEAGADARQNENRPSFVVNTLSGDGDGACTLQNCSLQDAIGAAEVFSIETGQMAYVTFDATVFAAPRKTITLSNSQLHIAYKVTITAPPAGVTIDGNNQFRVFETIGLDIRLNGLTITGGNTDGISNTGTLTLNDCTISGNHNSQGGGGGIFNSNGATLTVSNCIISDNTSDHGGGGLLNFGNATLTNSTLSNNSALIGGGVDSHTGSVTLTNCTLSGNNASSRGGGIYNSGGGKLNITNSTLSGNSATSDGGGLNNNSGSGAVTITSSTFSGNTARSGSAIINFGSGLFQIGNSILTSSPNDTSLTAGGNITSLGYNISSSFPGFVAGPNDRFSTDPLLGPLADNGGPTQTHALLPRSPAINRGNSNLATDQRGVARPQGSAADIGAYEAVLISVSDQSIVEGNGGTKTMTFAVTLSAPLTLPLSLNYQLVNGSAKSPDDFDVTALSDSDGASPGTLTIAAGQTSGSISVPILGDTLSEGTELFYVLLSNPSHAAFAKGRGTGTITDDDRAPALSIGDVSLAEGNPVQGAPGTKVLTFPVSLSAPSGQIVKVNFATANGTARSGSDYLSSNGVLSFAPGQITQNIRVTINGDTTIEGDETLYVILSNAVNASIGRGRGMGTIINDDASG